MAIQYKWAMLGCGVIGHQFAEAMQKIGGSFYAVGNRTHEKAVKFAEQYGIGKVYDKPEDIFKDPDVDIVYISTPHNTHSRYICQALAAGKHVLCEKSITLNCHELDEAVKLALQKHCVLAEAQTIYHMPIYRELNKHIAKGEFGPLRLMTMNFGDYDPYDMKNRFFNRSLAGGAMLDIGVYALSFVRWFMSSCPSEIASQVLYAPTGVDEQASILLKNEENEMATVMLSMHAKQPQRAMISFDKAYIEFMGYPRGDKAVITWTDDGHQEEIVAGETENALCYEIEDMERTISGGKDYMHLDYTVDVMSIMTKIRHDWRMKYPEEE